MKKNQQSIDGFTPRRRVDSLSRDNSYEKIAKKPVSNTQVQPRITEIEHSKKAKNREENLNEDIESALQNLEIEEVQENERKERIASKKQRKLLRKLEKKNLKREKKGKEALSLEQFKRRRILRRIFAIILLILIIVGGYFAYKAYKDLYKITNGNVIGAVFGEKKKLKADSNGRTNILLF